MLLMVSSNHVPELTHLKYANDGDIILGGLLNLHIFDSNRQCVRLDSIAALHRVEAMVYTIKEVNARDDILPNVTIGFEIYDSCVSEDVTLAATMEILRNETGCAETREHKLKGVVGPRRSSVSAAVSRVFGLNHVPQITYMATSDELSDKNAFPFYFRAVPPDRLQVSTMIDVVRHFGWKYVSIVNTDESYGRNGEKELKRQTNMYGICIASSQEVSRFSTNAQIDRIVATLLQYPKAKVVIMFAVTYMANRVLDAVKRANATDKFIWIASDGWGYNLRAHDNERVALGGFFVELYNTNSSGYEQYFRTLNPQSSTANPWFLEYWNEYLNCSSAEDERCKVENADGFSARMSISAVIDAVYIYSYALEELRKQLCNTTSGDCTAFKNADGNNLLQILRNTSFYGTRGLVQFDENGDLMGKYVVKNLQFVDGKYTKVPVALWDALAEDKLTMNDGLVVWAVSDNGDVVPESVCSDPCSVGHIMIPHGDTCCWDCFQCRDNEIPIMNNSKCEACHPLFWPDENFTACEPIPPTYIQWNDPIAVTVLAVSFVGLAGSIITLAGYIQYRDKPLIKASSRELSFIMLFGVTFSYIMVFIFVAKPTLATCIVVRLALMLCFTMTYGPMLTKVIRIYRIFTAGKKSTKRPRMTGATSQVVITTVIIAIQLLISGGFAMVVHPAARLVSPLTKEKRVELSCNIKAPEVITSVTYNLLLITLCCWFAFKTRKVPDNYNESRFISLSVYTTLVIWLAFIPTYLTIDNSSFKVAIISLATLLNSSVTLICLYVPKLYAVYFVKDDHTIAAGTTINAYVAAAGNRVSPMIAHLSTVDSSRS
ncbi:metabotropic glutamate receptor 3-like [Glandiceps talaboti]